MAGLEELAVVVDEAQREARAIPQLTFNGKRNLIDKRFKLQRLFKGRWTLVAHAQADDAGDPVGCPQRCKVGGGQW